MCLFCKIVSKEVPAKVLFEDDELLAFFDTRPMAPKHALVIPKKHLTSLDEASAADGVLLGKLMFACQRASRELGIAGSGFRVVVNNGTDGGQTVFHLHFHVLGGRSMAWPPG
jgi:histidine triad (HIT) family protein